MSARAWLAVALLLRLWWAWVLPFNDGPDEARHMRTIAFFADHGLPTRENIFSGEHGFYVATSPLPYAPYIALDLLWPGRAPLFAQRVLTALMGTLLAWLGFITMRRVRPALALPFVIFLALHPQLAFQAAYVNWDAWTFLICSAVVATWPDLGERRIRPVLLGALGGLCLLGKPTGFAVLPVLLALFLWARPSVSQFLTAGAACALVALPFLVHNASVLPGDPFGFNTVLGTVSADWEASVPGGWAQLFTSRWAINSFESMWAVFGHLARKVSNIFYVLFALLSLLAAVGVVRRFDRTHLVALVSVACSLALSYATSAINDFQPYGRYLFPSVIPLFGLFVSGCSVWGKWPLRVTIALCAVISPLVLLAR